MAGCSAVFILDLKGKILISRNYRGDVPMEGVHRFINKLLEEEDANVKPVLEEGGVSFVYIKHQNLYLLAVTNRNANVAMIVLFLYQIVKVFEEYFQALEEESIRDNFVVIHELLDEMMDFGYPQATEPKLLQEYITQESEKLIDKNSAQVIPELTKTTLRPENLKYRKNEVFLDVIESVNILANANGTLLRSEINGAVKMNCRLSGMPDIRLGLNDRLQFDSGRGNRGKSVEMEDVNFHQCVSLSRFEKDRTISFVPPDGEFELMNYRLNTQIKPLIWVETVVDKHARSRVEYMVKARSQFKTRSVANKVEIIIPVPPDASSPKFKTSMGTVKYRPELDAIVWSIKQFPGGKEYLMRAHFGLPSIVNEEEPQKKPPIQLKFEVPYFTVSGIQVRYLKIIEKSGYQALPWVRYITQSGDYQIRLG